MVLAPSGHEGEDVLHGLVVRVRTPRSLPCVPSEVGRIIVVNLHHQVRVLAAVSLGEVDGHAVGVVRDPTVVHPLEPAKDDRAVRVVRADDGVDRGVHRVEGVDAHHVGLIVDLEREAVVVVGEPRRDLGPDGLEAREGRLEGGVGLEVEPVIVVAVDDDVVEASFQCPPNHLLHTIQPRAVDRVWRREASMVVPSHRETNRTETGRGVVSEILLFGGRGPPALERSVHCVAEVDTSAPRLREVAASFCFLALAELTGGAAAREHEHGHKEDAHTHTAKRHG
mmetsp:Transcript_3759/g.7861  ORF Transcript_3759/g.7861 Transcript_3759/m.7861 type:complete len:282 (-) Transcript_3759:35-880(-)